MTERGDREPARSEDSRASTRRSAAPPWLVFMTVATLLLQPPSALVLFNTMANCWGMVPMSTSPEVQEGIRKMQREGRGDVARAWAFLTTLMGTCLGVLWWRHWRESRLSQGGKSSGFMRAACLFALLCWCVVAAFIALTFLATIGRFGGGM